MNLAHLHITGWLVAIILVFLVSNLYKQGQERQGKVLHMLLRLEYILILVSGIILFASYNQISGELIVKVIAGLWAIISMEMITVRTNKSKPTKAWWIQFFVAVAIAIILGFGRLPLGVLP